MRKVCARCKKYKNEDKFSKDNSREDKLNIYCRKCRDIMNENFKAIHPEIVKECNRNYYYENREEMLKRMKKWQKENPEKCRLNSLRYYTKKRMEKLSAIYA